jgi:hypothetical protein
MINEESGGGLKRSNSQIMKALHDTGDTEDESNKTAQSIPEQRRGLPKVRSGLNLAQDYVEAKEGKIDKKEAQF